MMAEKKIEMRELIVVVAQYVHGTGFTYLQKLVVTLRKILTIMM